MAESPVDLEKARAELTLLKQRERELEKKLGIHQNDNTLRHATELDKKLERRQNCNTILYIDVNQPTDGNQHICYSPHSPTSPRAAHPPTVLINFEDETDITENESITLNLAEEINYSEDDTDEYDGESLSDEINTQREQGHHESTDECDSYKGDSVGDSGDNYEEDVNEGDGMEGFNRYNSYNGEEYYHENSGNSSDEEEDKHVDLREKIRKDITENHNRELELQYERGSFENLAEEDSDDSDASELVQNEDIREKILQEIKREKIRDLEIQAKHRDEGFKIEDTSFDKITITTTTVSPEKMIEEEIKDFVSREKVLQKNNKINNFNKKIENNSRKSSIEYKHTDAHNNQPQEWIKQEIVEQHHRETEVQQLKRALSNSNLLAELNNKNEEDETLCEQNERELDTREKIIREIEEQKDRELELKKKSNPNKYNGSIINNSDEESEIDYIKCQRNESVTNQATESGKQLSCKNNSSMVVSNGIRKEKQRPSKESADLVKPLSKKFGSREDLLSYFGSDETAEPPAKFTNSIEEKLKRNRILQSSTAKVQIPKIFTNNQTKESKKNGSDSKIQIYLNNKLMADDSYSSETEVKEKKHQQQQQQTEQIQKQKQQMDQQQKQKQKMRQEEEQQQRKYQLEQIPQQQKQQRKQNSNQKQQQQQQQKERKQQQKQGKKQQFQNYFQTEQNVKKQTKESKSKKTNNPFRQFSPRANSKNPFLSSAQNTTESNGLHLNGETTISTEQLKSLSILPTDNVEENNKIKIKRIVNNKNPFNIATLAEQWERKSSQETKNAKTNKKLDEITKQQQNMIMSSKQRNVKKQSLEYLWKSQKPITTEEDNPDRDDRELMTYLNEQKSDAEKKPPTNQQPPVITLDKTIRKWEKRIAKNSKPGVEKVYFV